MILALVGGVGGAKLAHGLAQVTAPDALAIIVNTGDDFRHLGLAISPDLDTVMYTLAGLSNRETGWGVAGETWSFMAALDRLGGETWFRLGDRDLATHVERTWRLADGESLSAVTARFARRLGIAHGLAPMTDDALATMVETDQGLLAFQDYFVRLACAPRVTGIRFEGRAAPSPAFAHALEHPDLKAVVIGPSNPYLSIDPILAVTGIRARLAAKPVIAVSPIVGGEAIKGPAAKIMAERGETPSCLAVARHYRGLVDALAIDQVDRKDADAIAALGIRPLVTNTVMRTDQDRARLAETVSAFAETLS